MQHKYNTLMIWNENKRLKKKSKRANPYNMILFYRSYFFNVLSK